MGWTMHIKLGSWIKKGLLAGIGGAALSLALIGATTASASGSDDSTAGSGQVCLLRNTDGDCLTYTAQSGLIWSGHGWIPANPFLAGYVAPVLSDDYLLDDYVAPGYYYSYSYPYGYYYYGGVIVSSTNLPAPVYVVVAGAADVLGVDRSTLYATLQQGNSLEEIVEGYGYSESYFLNRFSYALEQRIAETLVNGTMQQWQATAVRSFVASSWFIDEDNLLAQLAQYT